VGIARAADDADDADTTLSHLRRAPAQPSSHPAVIPANAGIQGFIQAAR